MARKKKATNRKPKSKSSSAEPRRSIFERTIRTVFRPQVMLSAALLAAGFVLYPAFVRMLPDLSQRDEYRLQASEIDFPEPPRWIPENLLDQVIERGKLPKELSVLDKSLAERVAKAFEQHPWVTRPVNVRVSVPAQVEVTFEYRKPVAMVEVSDGFYPVDDEGVLLPPRDFPPSELARYPKISGLRTTPLGGVGSTWGDARVIGAAQIAVILLPYWNEWRLQDIEVPKRTEAKQKYEDLEFVVNTRGGSKIIWGRPPGHQHPLEITADQKIGKLKTYLSACESFDGNWEININTFMEVRRNPLPAAQLQKAGAQPGMQARRQ
ncbi:MAG: cell division protein FtsQ/DivIB [Planctomycetota bacterium]|jgi:hypothetical protein